jgi:hypothetical protein
VRAGDTATATRTSDDIAVSPYASVDRPTRGSDVGEDGQLFAGLAARNADQMAKKQKTPDVGVIVATSDSAQHADAPAPSSPRPPASRADQRAPARDTVSP